MELGVSDPTGDLPREGGEVTWLGLFSNLANRLRTPGWALLSDIVRARRPKLSGGVFGGTEGSGKTRRNGTHEEVC